MFDDDFSIHRRTVLKGGLGGAALATLPFGGAFGASFPSQP